MPRKRRTLTPEEQTLWNKVAARVETAAPGASKIRPPDTGTPEIRPDGPVFAPPIPPTGKGKTGPGGLNLDPFRVGSKAPAPKTAKAAPSFVDLPNRTSPNMDRRNFQRLIRGKLDIDATLDLHGLTAEQARQRLTVFVRSAHAGGLRLLLVITGKGQRADTDEFNRPRRGVLRSGVPEWLKTGAMSGLVLQVTQAHPKHGGGGAFYVYLRRSRG